jgi:hypothetical protein
MPDEPIDQKALINAVIWTGLVLGTLVTILLVANAWQANQAAKKANQAQRDVPSPNGISAVPHVPSPASDQEVTERA